MDQLEKLPTHTVQLFPSRFQQAANDLRSIPRLRGNPPSPPPLPFLPHLLLIIPAAPPPRRAPRRSSSLPSPAALLAPPLPATFPANTFSCKPEADRIEIPAKFKQTPDSAFTSSEPETRPPTKTAK